MISETEQIMTGETSHALLLSAWFFMYLHKDRSVGGLPNDFLSRGSSALFLFDKVICDKASLEAEEAFKGTWLGADLFSALKQEGILRPVDMREYLPQEFLDHLRDSGMTQGALRAMEAELADIKKGRKRQSSLRLLPSLAQLNHYMFMGLEISNTIHYEWQEHYLKVSPSATLPLVELSTEPADENPEARREQILISVLKALLPDFSLLPPLMPGSESAAAMRRNIAKEKLSVLRYAYGDPEMSLDRFHEFRLGPDFRHSDAKIDEQRKAQAWQNFELLMKVREETKDVRTGVQRVFSDVVHGKRTIADVKAELSEHQQELLAHLPTRRSIGIDIRLGGFEFAVAIAEAVGHLLHVVPGASAALSAFEVWRKRKERRQYSTLRQQFPLAFLLRDFRSIQASQRKKLTPRRGRR